MNTKQIISILLAITIFCGCSSAMAAAGSQSDPLISKSYIDNTYINLVLSDPLEALKSSMTVLQYKLNQLSSGAQGQSVIVANPGGTLALSSGSGFTLLSGLGSIATLQGIALDLSTGQQISGNQALIVGHRYLAAENTSFSVRFSSSSKISVFGEHSTTPGDGPSFTDVATTDWFYSDVTYAVKRGLINGRTSTTYAPTEKLSIAEAIKLAACMHQLYYNGSVSLVVDPQTWYMSYVRYAVQNGIISKTYTDYNASISRREFVSIFYSALPSSEYTLKNSVADNAIPDVKLNDTAATEIYAFYRAGILIGRENGVFSPTDNIQRSEVASIVTRMLEKDTRKSITL